MSLARKRAEADDFSSRLDKLPRTRSGASPRERIAPEKPRSLTCINAEPDPERYPLPMQDKETTLDLRELGCGQRHGLVFQCLSVLDPGFSIVIVNDHDPEPLRRQLLHEYGDRLSWKLEQIGSNEFKATIQLTEGNEC